MVSFNEVQAQLVKLDSKLGFIGINEVRKIARSIEPNEIILDCLKGWHKGRSTLLCLTDKKIEWIDVRRANHNSVRINFLDITKIQLKQNGVVKSIHIHTLAGITNFTLWQKQKANRLHALLTDHISLFRRLDKHNGFRYFKNNKNYNITRTRVVLARHVGSICIAG